MKCENLLKSVFIHERVQLTFLSANFKGNICETPAGEVIVAVVGLVDGFVLHAENMSC